MTFKHTLYHNIRQLIKRSILPLAVMTLVFAVTFAVSVNYRVESLKLRERDHLQILKENSSRIMQRSVLNLYRIMNASEIKAYTENPSPEALRTAAEHLLSQASLHPEFDQLRLLNMKGLEVIRVNRGSDGIPLLVERGDLQDKSDRYYFRDAVDSGTGRIYVSRFDLNIEQGQIERPLKPMIRFSTVLTDSRGKAEAVFILNLLGREILEAYSSLEALNSMHRSREYLIDSEGYYLKHEDHGLAWAFMYEDRRSMNLPARDALLWDRMQNNSEDQFMHRGELITFSRIHPLAEFSPRKYPAGRLSDSGPRMVQRSDYHWYAMTRVQNSELRALRRGPLLLGLFIYSMVLALNLFLNWKWVTADTENRELAEQRQQTIIELNAAISQIRTLEGLLPVCSHCRKVRDDDGYWQQVDEYLVKKTDIQFSHGICQSCAEKIYGQEKWFRDE